MDRAQQTLSDALHDRGTAYTDAERRELGLVGRLPAAVETLEQQAARAHAQWSRQPDDLVGRVVDPQAVVGAR
jgi:malate dehydrogenase (oxaloacetate-decarboxylating)